MWDLTCELRNATTFTLRTVAFSATLASADSNSLQNKPLPPLSADAILSPHAETEGLRADGQSDRPYAIELVLETIRGQSNTSYAGVLASARLFNFTFFALWTIG